MWNSVIPDDINKTGGLSKKMKMSVGAKMLRSKTDVEKKIIVNYHLRLSGHISDVLKYMIRTSQ